MGYLAGRSVLRSRNDRMAQGLSAQSPVLGMGVHASARIHSGGMGAGFFGGRPAVVQCARHIRNGTAWLPAYRPDRQEATRPGANALNTLKKIAKALGAILAAIGTGLLLVLGVRAWKATVGKTEHHAHWWPDKDNPGQISVATGNGVATVKLPPGIKTEAIEAVEVVATGSVVVELKHTPKDRAGMIRGDD